MQIDTQRVGRGYIATTTEPIEVFGEVRYPYTSATTAAFARKKLVALLARYGVEVS